ncbi:helix-turn-helix domain-containing protein [Phytohabitans sp. ZYX-F-186]|uniref:Helix-turn-helix domain-containing protein n=1 Tax=Phytohabitans maris TaxID=3071409 RepID=A0ABU0ZFK2_9ACTN|nr:helix-turn-helix domain-containing protein [Phytohabitans sp. ZYX-F-186]MDQ7905768.1 helix-turn-helix domain-containing protein [Phytohabitans sp. ZYX-F-186]
MRSRDRAGDASLEALVPALIGRLPHLLDEVRRLLTADWPDYAQFLAEEQTEVEAAAEGFIRWLVEFAEQYLSEPPGDLIPTPSTPVALFEEIGRVQWREGRDLSALLSAYQLGARVAWHEVSSTALQTGVAPTALAALAEAVFAYVDRLSSASARGYVAEQSEAAADRERLRDDLVELLLSDRSDSAAVRAAATRAGWPLPREVAVVLVDPDNPVGQAMLARLDASCLLIRRRQLTGAVIPDPVRPGRRQRLAAKLSGAGAVVGHPVRPEQLPASVEIAEIALRLSRAGTLTDDPVFVAEHLDAIIVHRDARLLQALRRQCLAPLAGLTPAVRQRLTETLAAWLRHLGDRQAVAAELRIHPQTVRYRMARLHDLLGATLDDPAGRASLTLALAWGVDGVEEADEAAGGGSAAGGAAPVRGRVTCRGD